MTDWLMEIVLAVIASIGTAVAAVVAVLRRRDARRESERQAVERALEKERAERRDERKAELESHERLIESLQTRMDAQDQRIMTLERTVASLRDAHTELVVENANLVRDVADRDVKIAELEQGIDERDVIIAGFTGAHEAVGGS